MKVSSEQRLQLSFGCVEWFSPYKPPLFGQTASLRGWRTLPVLPPLELQLCQKFPWTVPVPPFPYVLD